MWKREKMIHGKMIYSLLFLPLLAFLSLFSPLDSYAISGNFVDSIDLSQCFIEESVDSSTNSLHYINQNDYNNISPDDLSFYDICSSAYIENIDFDYFRFYFDWTFSEYVMNDYSLFTSVWFGDFNNSYFKPISFLVGGTEFYYSPNYTMNYFSFNHNSNDFSFMDNSTQVLSPTIQYSSDYSFGFFRVEFYTYSSSGGGSDGSIYINSNGTYDVSNYSEAVVDVPSGGGSGASHDDLVNIKNAILLVPAVLLLIYFFYCIYRIIIVNTRR